MSQFGSGDMQAQTSQAGQVTFFDPSKFQKGATSDFPAAQQQQPEQPPASSTQNFAQTSDPSQSAWSSWGTWNGEANPYIDPATNQSNQYIDPASNQNTPYIDPSTSQNNYVNSSSGQEVQQPVYDSNVGQHGGVNDMNYNQQWYGQNEWNQQYDTNQYHFDPNTQQWVPNNQYVYQAGTEASQYSGYNQYWAGGENGQGVNGHEHSNLHQPQADGHIAQPVQDYSVSDSNVAQTSVETGQDSGTSTSATDSSPRQETTSDDLDVSTTESESQSHSLGQYEEGSLDGYFQNDDFVQESETKVVSESVSEPLHAARSEATSDKNVIQQSSGTDNTEASLAGQMQAVSLNDNALSDNPQISQPGTSQGYDTAQYDAQPPASQPDVALYSSHPAVGTDSHPPLTVVTQEQQQTPTFSDWEMVPSHKDSPAAHSRNASIDNNVHFFISSTNSSARVSPAVSAKTGGDDQETTQQTGQRSDIPQDQEPRPDSAPNNPGNLGPPPMSLRPPSGDSGQGDNPFRKSPNTSMLSSTQLEATRGNLEGSPVILNRSLSPIAPSDELTSERQRQTDRDTDSPDIHHTQPAGQTADIPVSTGHKKPGVPQSPIMHRKESPFQPPGKVTESRGKPLKASHDLPGVSSYVERQLSDEGKYSKYDRRADKKPEKPGDRVAGRKTPDWDRTDRKYEGRRTPDWDSDRRRREGRRTPDWDPTERRREGRKTPDWDRDEKKREGRRTPDWDAHDRKSEGRRTPDWDRPRDRGYDRRDRDRVSGRPPTGPSDSRSHRTRQSAFQNYQTSRNKNNVSPATSLWDTPENLPNVSNILLMPASDSTSKTEAKDTSTAPVELTPVASLITSLSEQMKTDDPKDNVKDKELSKNKSDMSVRSDRDKDSRYDRDRDANDSSIRGGGYRDKDRGDRDRLRNNRSYESLRERDRGYRDSRNNSRERNSLYGSRDSLDQDDSRERGRRGDSRERERGYRDRDSYYDRPRDRDRERPPSRTSTVDGYGRRDYRDRDRDRDRDYYRRDKPDRPRSRQGERPSSRQGEEERPRSRTDLEREQYYKDKYKNTAYDYDEYYRRGGHYYDRDYYDYYYGNYAQGGYYDEYGYYHANNTQARYQYDYYHRRSRTGTPGSLSDGGEEISKIAESSKPSESKSEKKRFDYPPDLHDYSRGGYDEYNSYYGYEHNGYRWDPDINNWVATTTEAIPQRQTPEKFVIPHVQACFGPNGQLVRVVPNRPADGEPATVEIIDVQELLRDTEESEELNDFPGPLVKGDTHKNDVLLFSQRKAKECSENMNLEDRESAELIWRFLELLIKQNGTVVGTDIADLLLQGHEPTTLDYKRTGMKIAASSDCLEGDDESEGSRVSRGTTPVDKSLVNTRTKSLEDTTDRFRHLLLYGRKKDAIEWAMKNNLWGHALFLASKMDSRAHANVMTRFANVAMRMNDPLQTLYQLMSGRQPAAVTSVTEERWGDWRPHLAMVLSNHTPKPDLDRKCITTLGDTLASKGLLHASHFCYLMSQVSFGSYTRKSSKIVLIGSSHGLPLEYFANNDAVQCTEIYEYALALGNTCLCLPNFQYFKYLYCTRLVDCGYAQEALQYCEVISRNINANPAIYHHVLVKLVYDLSNQLKYADPQLLEENEEDAQDPDWLRGLHTTLVQFEEGAIQPMSGSATPAYFGGGTTASSESGEVGMYMQGTDNGTSYIQDQSYMQNIGQMYSIQEQAQYQQSITGQTGYQQNITEQTCYQQSITENTEYQQSITGQTEYQQYGQGQYDAQGQMTDQQTAGHQYGGEHMAAGAENQYVQQGDNSYQPATEAYTQQPTEGQYGNVQWPDPATDPANQGQAYQSTNQQPADLTNQNTGSQYQAGDQQVPHYQPNQMTAANQHTGHWSHSQQHTGFQPNVNLGESQNSGQTGSMKRSSLASTSSFSQDGADDLDEDGVDQTDSSHAHHNHTAPSIFDLQPTQQKIIAPRLRQRTISESSTNSGTAGHAKKPQQNSQDKGEGLDGKAKQSKQNQGGGIFSRIGGLFSRKNEMKLPDDKEPSIIWDPVKNKWVDKDSDETETGPAPPPPKDTELSGPSQMPTVPERPSPALAPAGAPPPAMGGNKFSRRKGIGARSQYVDVMNPKPATTASVPPTLFNTLPSSHSAPAIFNPGGLADTSATESAPQQQDSIPEERNDQGAHHSNMPKPGSLQLPPSENISRSSSWSTFDSHSFDSYISEDLSRTSSMSSLSREVQNILRKAQDTTPAPIPSGLPAMFNPAEFTANQSFKQPTAPAPGHRLSSRRVYPK